MNDYNFRLEKIISPRMDDAYFEVLSKPSKLNCSVDEYFMTLDEIESMNHIKSTFNYLSGFSGLNVSVNVNYSILTNPVIMGFIYNSARNLKGNNLKLSLEVNENCLSLISGDEFDELVNDFSKIGVDFWLDDFGCGSANFSSVMNSKFSIVKIDKNIFWDFYVKHKNLLIEMINFMKFHGCLVIIEGVEEKEHFNFALKHGCYSQGYLFNS